MTQQVQNNIIKVVAIIKCTSAVLFFVTMLKEALQGIPQAPKIS